ncbi:MAG TPA: hypothetical protein PKC22_07225 [Rhodocyclaceae bacterium]|nr:hypothetical protein [Rhodocyclaceae bacterium]
MNSMTSARGEIAFRIVDNLRAHRARKLKEWLEGKEDRIEQAFLPSLCSGIEPGRVPEPRLQDRASQRAGPPQYLPSIYFIRLRPSWNG